MEETRIGGSHAGHGEKGVVANERRVRIAARSVTLEGELGVPDAARGVVVIVHGSGSNRRSPRNRPLAQVLRDEGFATLRVDLLSPEEEHVDAFTRHLRFDVDLLARRLIAVTDWLGSHGETSELHVGCFGAGTAAAALLMASTRRSDRIGAVVSRGGRPDLAEGVLSIVQTATLLIVGSNDEPGIELNQHALEQIAAKHKELAIVPGASYLFDEAGTLSEVARLAAAWYGQHLSVEVALH